MTILADKNIPFLREILSVVKYQTPSPIKGEIPSSHSADLDYNLMYFDPAEGLPKVAHGVEVLLVRTVSKVNSETLSRDGYPDLKVIATASAGFDHIDVQYLDTIGIRFLYAPGCNAIAVGEYVATGLLHWTGSRTLSANETKVGIVGVGHTGSAVAKILSQTGFQSLLYDPPKEINSSGSFKSSSLQDILDCDVISFHVPLTKKPDEHPTHHWLDKSLLDRFQGNLIVNASRGGVVDESALLHWKAQDPTHREFIVDVWENEPCPNSRLVDAARIATPHIAGYSNQSKFNATHMVVKSVFDYLNPSKLKNDYAIENGYSLNDTSPYYRSIEQELLMSLNNDNYVKALEKLHIMFSLSDRMKHGISGNCDSDKVFFAELRMHSGLRDEYEHIPRDMARQLEKFEELNRLIGTRVNN